MIADRYTLLRELGRGGAGAVWLARDENLGREVAMKRQLGASGVREEARVWREARVAARLQHASLVSLYDLAEDDGDLWLVMEYVAGQSLTGLVAEEGPLSPDAAARILAGVADGLRHAHGQGIVHRDVKPSNILLGPRGEPKLADFGIALMSDQSATTTLTASGVVHGSPAYLAPEVATGRGATTQSDVWSLGATLFHALTGRPPYSDPDGNVVAILYRIVHEPAPATDRSGWLQPLLAGTMTHDPAQRWTLDQVVRFLGRGRPGTSPGADETLPYAAEPADDDAHRTAVLTPARPPAPPPVTAPPAPQASPVPPAPPARPVRSARPRRGRWPLALAACLVVALIAGVAIWAAHRGDDAADRRDPSGTASTPSSPPADQATEDGARAFVEDYLSTAPASPADGFAMLTPAYQRQSGDLEGYESFWGSVTNVTSISPVDVRLDPLQATYTYTYTRRHEGKVTETVTLDLTYADGTYLIAGDGSN